MRRSCKIPPPALATPQERQPAAFYRAQHYRPEESVGYLMRQILNTVGQEVERQLAHTELTNAQWIPLFKLSIGQASTAAELARERSTTDRRVVTITLTDSGREAAQEIPKVLSMVFLYVHVAWFCAWILLNTGHAGMVPFDPYPYGLLTMVVSLEAIFLTTFVLISQNLLGKEAARLTDLSLQIGLLTEHELTRVLQMLRAIQSKIGITNDEDSNLADSDLEMETRLEDVLSEIERLQRREETAPRHRQRMK